MGWCRANLRENVDGKDDYPGCGAQRYDSECQGQDSGQGGNPTGAAEVDLCRETVGGWTDSVGLQHPEGEHVALGVAPARRKLRRKDPKEGIPKLKIKDQKAIGD